ncbi:MAG: methyltransferase domain-containing protein [Gemmatimonadota bacterium]
MVVITANTRDIIFDAVRAMYADVARNPQRTFHFPTGRSACEFVGYPAALLNTVLPGALESFAGVGYPFQCDVIRAGNVVLDIGSGSGTDALIAARKVGALGRVIALDITEEMRAKLRANALAAAVTNIETLEGNAEQIPLPDASVDVVTTNGVLNLVPEKERAVAEIRRVLRPGGRVQLADIVLDSLPSAACRAQPQLWAECIVGATTEAQYVDLFRTRFDTVEVVDRLDYFAGSSSAETRKVAHSFGASAIVLKAR